MFRRVFVPVDWSAALAAARLAARLARAQRGRLRSCYVIDRRLFRGAALVGAHDQLRKELAAEGRRVLRRVHALCRRLGVPSSEALVEGDVVQELVQAARRYRADVMVVSARGHGRLKALLLGSFVPALIQRAPCPLLLVRPGASRRRAPRRRTPRRRGA